MSTAFVVGARPHGLAAALSLAETAFGGAVFDLAELLLTVVSLATRSACMTCQPRWNVSRVDADGITETVATRGRLTDSPELGRFTSGPTSVYSQPGPLQSPGGYRRREVRMGRPVPARLLALVDALGRTALPGSGNCHLPYVSEVCLGSRW